MFPGPLSFDAAQAEIRFDARYLALPLRRDEKALRQMLQRALPLTVLQYRRDRLLVQQVRQALVAHPAQAHSAEGAGRLLHMSARTLHRQLKEEGASLQQLKDEVRCERAKDLLYRSGKPVKQVAAAAGFRNEKSFIRAFQASGPGPAGGVSAGCRDMTRNPSWLHGHCRVEPAGYRALQRLAHALHMRSMPVHPVACQAAPHRPRDSAHCRRQQLCRRFLFERWRQHGVAKHAAGKKLGRSRQIKRGDQFPQLLQGVVLADFVGELGTQVP